MSDVPLRQLLPEQHPDGQLEGQPLQTPLPPSAVGPLHTVGDGQLLHC